MSNAKQRKCEHGRRIQVGDYGPDRSGEARFVSYYCPDCGLKWMTKEPLKESKDG